MKIAGIITEYNPFHNGHKHHIEETKRISKCDLLINVMSGNHVQRGEPAICDKWQRAQVAIEQGCDVVFELPFPYVMQSADHFAYGAVRSLALAQVDQIIFGSETNDIEKLMDLAKKDKIDFTAFTKTGITLAKAQEQSTGSFASNDILGISYLRALQTTSIEPYCIQRTNAYHDTSIENEIASASAIRHAFFQGKDITQTTCMAQVLTKTFSCEAYYPYLQTLLLTTPASHLKTFFLVDEGIEHQFIKQAKICTTWKSFVEACTSKRYTHSRIQRTLIHILNQTTKETMQQLPPLQHLRLLAFNEKGRNYIHYLQNQGVPIASKFNQIPQPFRDLEWKSSVIYANALPVAKRATMVASELQAPRYIRS